MKRRRKVLLILVVEDNKRRVEQFEKWKPDGFRLIWSRSAGQAIGNLKKSQPRDYDGLMLDHLPCKKAVAAIAKELLCTESLPELVRENTQLQGCCDCGFRAIFWAEELCRRKLGEGSWTIPWDKDYRLERIRKIIEKVV